VYSIQRQFKITLSEKRMKKSYEIVEGNKMNMIKKSLAVGVILLFFGVAVAPSINFSVVKAVSDNELIEVTSEACGIKGFGNTTVKLTKQQYQDLQNYLVKFRDKLNTTTTREEAVPIFKEAVVELDKYELLPKGMNVDQAQKLVTGPYQNKNILKLQEKLLHNHLMALDNNSNYFCLIAGNTFRSGVIALSSVISVGMLFLSSTVLGYLAMLEQVPLIYYFLLFPFYCLWFFALLSIFFPATIFSVITLGESNPLTGYNPASGWIFSFGLNTLKIWNGSFFGDILAVPIGTAKHIGVVGFSGLKLTIPETNFYYRSFYIGTALWVKIDDSPPWWGEK